MCGHDVEQPVDVAGVRDPDGVADGYLALRTEFKELLGQFGYSGRGDRALERAAEGDREIGSDPEACAPCPVQTSLETAIASATLWLRLR